MLTYLIAFIDLTLLIIYYGVFIHVILGYFLDPYHPIRQFTARIFEPMLSVIRQYMPRTGMIDLSPLVLAFLVYLIRRLLFALFF